MITTLFVVVIAVCLAIATGQEYDPHRNARMDAEFDQWVKDLKKDD